jgi:hypothetical protein
MKTKRHYSDKDGFDVTSRDAIFTFINTNRNFGKTWLFKKRAFKRALKRGRKTIWVRRFKKEVKEAAAKFFTSADLRKFCGIEWYDPDTKQGNCKQVGNTFYVKRRGRWEWFLQIVALTDAANMRGVDDVKVDTIVFDEYRTTPERYARYRGNEVTDFIDIFFSAKREHEIRCFFLGNKESTTDPYFAYFGIPTFPDTFEGIRMFRGGSICCQFINNEQNTQSEEYERKTQNLLRGTSYGAYIYESATKTKKPVRVKKSPVGAAYYVQLCIRGQYVRILLYDGIFYVSAGADKSKPVYCDAQTNAPRHFLLTKRLKRFFVGLENALTDGRVYYESNAVYERVVPFYKWLGI